MTWSQVKQHAVHGALHKLFGFGMETVVKQPTLDHVIPRQPNRAIPVATARDFGAVIRIVGGQSRHAEFSREAGMIRRMLPQALSLLAGGNSGPQRQETDNLFALQTDSVAC